jgi:predicted secreted protein
LKLKRFVVLLNTLAVFRLFKEISMRKILLLALVLVLFPVVISACAASGGGAGSHNVILACTDLYYQKNITRPIEVASGDTIVVNLCSNRADSFKWNEKPTFSTNSIVQTNYVYTPPASADRKDTGKETFTLRVSGGKGNCQVKFDYSRPWEGTQSTGTFTLDVTIK